MRIKAKFVINRAGFRNQILKDFRDAGFVKAVMPAVEAVAPPGTVVKTSVSKSRVRIRIVDEQPNASHREAQSGALSQALNRIHV